MRNPIILPRDHLLVKLLLRHLHTKRAHCGYKSLIHKARRKYWIIGVRSSHFKVYHLQETSEETAGPANGADPVFTSGSRFSSFFQHCHWHVWTLAHQAQSEVSERSSGRNIHLHDNKGSSLGTCQWQNIWCISDGVPSFRELAWSPECLLVWLWYKLCWCTSLLTGNYAELEHSQNSKCSIRTATNGYGIYLMRAIKMVSWKLSSSLSGKVSMLPARVKPLPKSNGEHFCRRPLTSLTDVLCIQVLTTSGKVLLSHQTIFYGSSSSTTSTRTWRKDQPQTSSKKYPRSGKWILEMLDAVLRTKSLTTKQVVPYQRKCWSWWFSFGVGPESETITMEPGSCRCHVSRKRWPGQEGENQDPVWWTWQTNPQVVSHSNQRGTECLIKSRQRNNEHYCYFLINFFF